MTSLILSSLLLVLIFSGGLACNEFDPVYPRSLEEYAGGFGFFYSPLGPQNADSIVGDDSLANVQAAIANANALWHNFISANALGTGLATANAARAIANSNAVGRGLANANARSIGPMAVAA